MGDKKKAKKFVDKMLKTKTSKGIPELYFSNTNKPNENNPLGWSESLFIVALYMYNKKFLNKKIDTSYRE
jgi:GH15 family glucan-1,4-alpha-glucosidase